MSNEPVSSPRTRRSLLAAALGAGIGTIASALGRPLPANAADGTTVTVGRLLTGSASTAIDIRAAGNGNVAFAAASHGGIGVAGISDTGIGVQGNSTAGTGIKGLGPAAGVDGSSASGPGVHGSSTSGTGVSGLNDGSPTPGVPFSGIGVRGVSLAGSGFVGFAQTGGELLPFRADRTGVFGYSNAGSNAAGVHGQTFSGVGVKASATAGTSLLATATTGTALHVDGKASFTGPDGRRLGSARRTWMSRCRGVWRARPSALQT